MFVVEQNRDAQLRALLHAGDRAWTRRSCARSCITAGLPMPAATIVDGVNKALDKEVAA